MSSPAPPPSATGVSFASPEVQDLDPALASQEQVLRLEIAVQHAVGVCDIEPLGDLDAVFHGFALGMRPVPRRERRVSPSRSSETMNGVPLCSPTSKIVRRFA